MSSKPRILVVEDEPKVLSFIKKGLEENGFDVHTAENGPDGLDLARALDFSIIILDIMLPGLSGIELAMQLHRTGNKSRILMLTALGTLDDKLRGFDAGAHDYLVKPFEFPELLARVRSLLRRESDEATSQFLRAADLTMDLDRKVVKRGDGHIDLTAREFILL